MGEGFGDFSIILLCLPGNARENAILCYLIEEQKMFALKRASGRELYLS